MYLVVGKYNLFHKNIFQSDNMPDADSEGGPGPRVPPKFNI